MTEPRKAFSPPSGAIPPPIDWAAEDARVATEYREEARLRARRELAKALPPRYASADTDLPELAAWAAALAVKDMTNGPAKGPALLLLGGTGVGKTHAAIAALRRYVAAGGDATPVMTTAPDLYADLRPKSGKTGDVSLERYTDAKLLMVDDLGAAKTSEWVEEVNYRLINHRYNHELPTLFTSNVPPRELGAVLGERVTSRLTEMCRMVVLKGPDRRRAA
ncbi:ATP-binding protein [Amycolatopsis roodepoortensis]|uniref:DNA replication protein DnaC n=1 Tax=Amycolatopsis roodepoortensis TaxID=700274 RepID=A0ABR9L3C4_9PSEU|nr:MULTISPECIES: ATP-binding protein [Amycolatopsis]MBE1575040.1 DNA replication protein DnaC [Amycolatopsis roodepoortensis]GHG97347.1 hypothetical protein GCM10017788_76790 [Amycolatopsis acidiphila]